MAMAVATVQERVARAAALASFAQADRSAGLRVGGIPDGTHPSLRGAFTRDATAPDANLRPHWSTAEGGHLYYSNMGRWCLQADGFTPDKTACAAWIATGAEVPVGPAAWRYWDGSAWVDRILKVTELSPTEAADPAPHRGDLAQPSAAGKLQGLLDLCPGSEDQSV
jgi:hypothetical protein